MIEKIKPGEKLQPDCRHLEPGTPFQHYDTQVTENLTDEQLTWLEARGVTPEPDTVYVVEDYDEVKNRGAIFLPGTDDRPKYEPTGRVCNDKYKQVGTPLILHLKKPVGKWLFKAFITSFTWEERESRIFFGAYFWVHQHIVMPLTSPGDLYESWDPTQYQQPVGYGGGTDFPQCESIYSYNFTLDYPQGTYTDDELIGLSGSASLSVGDDTDSIVVTPNQLPFAGFSFGLGATDQSTTVCNNTWSIAGLANITGYVNMFGDRSYFEANPDEDPGGVPLWP